MNTSGAQTQLVLGALQECVQYNISVRAYTSQGPGPFSKPILDSSLNCEFLNTYKHMDAREINTFFNVLVIYSASSGPPAT